MDHGNGDGAIERYDGRRLYAFELIVEAEDLRPVRFFRVHDFAMLGSDGGLQREGTSTAPQSFGDERQGFRDLLMIPAAAILFFEDDDVASVVETGVATGIVQEHKRDEPGGFGGGKRSREGAHEASETDRFAAQVGSD
jgi:hypothetical protein